MEVVDRFAASVADHRPSHPTSPGSPPNCGRLAGLRCRMRRIVATGLRIGADVIVTADARWQGHREGHRRRRPRVDTGSGRDRAQGRRPAAWATSGTPEVPRPMRWTPRTPGRVRDGLDHLGGQGDAFACAGRVATRIAGQDGVRDRPAGEGGEPLELGGGGGREDAGEDGHPVGEAAGGQAVQPGGELGEVVDRLGLGRRWRRRRPWRARAVAARGVGAGASATPTRKRAGGRSGCRRGARPWPRSVASRARPTASRSNTGLAPVRPTSIGSPDRQSTARCLRAWAPEQVGREARRGCGPGDGQLEHRVEVLAGGQHGRRPAGSCRPGRWRCR